MRIVGGRLRIRAHGQTAVVRGLWPLDLDSLGSRTDEGAATEFVYVDAVSGLDANAGTTGSPVQTLTKAVELAEAHNEANDGVTIIVRAGTYREAVSLPNTGLQTSAPIIIQAETAGTAIVSGSDVYTGWTADGSDYSHAWTYDWGLVAYPPGWEGAVTLTDIMRRRELVFINGTRLVQVATRGEMVAGTFYVSEGTNLIFIRPPVGVVVATSTVEVAVRAALLLVNTRDNVVVRGLTFTHDNSAVGGTAALTVQSSADVRVENCTMPWNLNRGLSFFACDHVTVANSTAHNNGVCGIGGYQVYDSVFSNTATSFNNWKGFEQSFTDWDSGGIKLLLLRQTALLTHTAVDNQAWGIWLDTDCVYTLVRGATCSGSLYDGIFLEAVQGPIAVEDSNLSNNTRAGLSCGNAAHIALTGTTLDANGSYQLLISGNPAGRTVTDHVTGQVYTAMQSADWRITGNTVTAAVNGNGLCVTTLALGAWESFYQSMHSDFNHWENSADTTAMWWVSGEQITLAEWRTRTGQDANSTP